MVNLDELEQTTAPLRGKRSQAFASLNAVLKIHLRRSADGRKAVSHATIADRAEFYSRMIRQLHDQGYQLTDVHHLKPRHIEALMRLWEQQGLSASTLQKRFSYLTILCRWLGKASMLRPAASYLDDPARYQRTAAADHDHSWTARGVDPEAKIAEIATDDPAVARVLRLQHALGLRIQEASLLNPARDRVNDHLLRVVAGTKGGRPRTVPIETDDQRAVLAEADTQAQRTQRAMIPVEYDLKCWLKHCYHVLARHGVTRKDGLVSHGLRHQYANDQYEQLTGEPSPVRGGGSVDAEAHRRAQLDVSSRLGHARVAITATYYGKPGVPPVAPEAVNAAQALRVEVRVQQQLLAARIQDRLSARQNGRGPLSARTLALRGTLLQQMLTILARRGHPLHTPDALSATHVEILLHHWQQAAVHHPASARNAVPLLAQLCDGLDRPDWAAQVRTTWQRHTQGERIVRPPALSHDEITARIDRIRAHQPRVALHLELVRVLGLTHRQAARLQPAASYRDGYLVVFWETPKDQVLRFAVTGERQRAVLADAQALLPESDSAVCPSEIPMNRWLQQVYRLLRTVGRIGIPGEPTLAELKDPDAPTPTVLARETWLLQRAGLIRPPTVGSGR